MNEWTAGGADDIWNGRNDEEEDREFEEWLGALDESEDDKFPTFEEWKSKLNNWRKGE